MNPVDIAWYSGPDGWTARDVALAIPKGSDTNNIVFAVFAFALNRAPRITHAASNATIAKTKVPLLRHLQQIKLRVLVRSLVSF